MLEDMSILEKIYLAELVTRWAIFKRTHDYRELKIRCCENSAALFDVLDRYEALVEGAIKEAQHT